MKRFRFPLQPLLTAREQIERRHQQAVAAAESERRRLEEALRAAQQGIAGSKAQARGHLVGTLNMNALRASAAVTVVQMREAQRIVIDLAGAHRRLEHARAGLVTAARDRRAIELLRERAMERWRREKSRREDTIADELAVQQAFALAAKERES